MQLCHQLIKTSDGSWLQATKSRFLESLNFVRRELLALRKQMGGYDQLKRYVNEAILNISLEYERKVNELKYQLDNAQQKLESVQQLQLSQQNKAAELLNEKDETIAELKSRLEYLTDQNQRMKEARKAKEESNAQSRDESMQEVQKLNLRINDLLAIIHDKTQLVEEFELRDRQVSTSRQVFVTDENVSHRANRRRPSMHQPLIDKSFAHTSVNKQTDSRAVSRRHSKHSKMDAENRSLMTIHTANYDTFGDHHYRDADASVLSKLQHFVSELTATHRRSPLRNELKLIDKNLEEKYSVRPEWDSSMKVRDPLRRYSRAYGRK